MSVTLLASLAMRVLALGWALTLLRRPTDWRFAFLGGLIAFMIFCQALKADISPEFWRLRLETDYWEFRSLIISLLAFAAVYYLKQILQEYKAVKSALCESEQRFRDFAETASDYLWEMGPDLRFNFTEKRTGAKGIDATQLLGKTRWELAGADSELDPKWRQHRADLEAHRPIQGFVFDYEISGRTVHVRINGKPIFDSQGQFQGYRGTASDITAEFEAEKALHANQNRLRLLLISMGEAVYGLDTAGNCTFCNPACLQMLGYNDPSELQGRNMHQLIHHTRSDGTPYPNQECNIYQSFRLGEGTHVIDEVMWRRDGTSFPAEYRSFPVVQEEQVIGAVVTFTDITERSQAKEALRQHEAELAHVQRRSTLDEMAATMAHELNQPLTALVNYAKGCLRRLRLGNLDKQDLDEVMTEICEQSERASNVLCRVGRFVGHAAPGSELVDLGEVMRSVRDLLEPELHANRIVVNVDLGGSAPLVLGRTIEIEQVFLNLIKNAIDAMRDAASDRRGITIEISSSQHEQIEITVSDTGPGLAAGTMEKIFEPFVTTKDGGMGMGLPICRTIVEGHGGRIWAEAGSDGGGAVRVVLPAFQEGMEHAA